MAVANAACTSIMSNVSEAVPEELPGGLTDTASGVMREVAISIASVSFEPKPCKKEHERL